MTQTAELQLAAKNLRKLGVVLTGIPQRQHDQSMWGDKDSHSCATVGCALGWAAMSGAFKGQGLRYGVQTSDGWAKTTKEAVAGLENGSLEPILHGQLSNWRDASNAIFGPDAFAEIFTGCMGNKRETIAAMNRLAADYERRSSK